MKNLFPGTMRLVHIHHNSDCKNPELYSSKKLNHCNLHNVRRFINLGFYPEAEIISHQINNKHLPLLPSAIIAAETALNWGAELHLWIEDDAIIFDPLCSQWTKLNTEIGTYRNTKKQKMIVSAYFLSRPSFDMKIIDRLKSYTKEFANHSKTGSQYEHLLWKSCKSVTNLNPDFAYRHHNYPTFTKTLTDVQNWLKKTLPITNDDLSLLTLDFKK